MNRCAIRLTVLALGCTLVLGPSSTSAEIDHVALTVTGRIELGPVSERSWDNGVRWCQSAVTKDGGVLVFYCDRYHKIVYRYSADGEEFAEPAQVASGLCPAVALDAEDNIHLVFKGAGKRASLKKLTCTGPGKWDVSGPVTQPLARFGEGPINFPSILINPGSGRIWCMTNYQTVDIFSLPNTEWYPLRKPRGQAVVSYSDDGGTTWAEPVYVGSDSGDEGSGVVVLRPWRGQAAWFWTFWDCATPAWGFFDGTRCRGLREFFPHKRSRMAVAHPWDTIEDRQGRLIFATGMGPYTPGQVYKVFNGSKWSEEIWISDKRAVVTLLGDGRYTFCAASEGGRISQYQLEGTRTLGRPVLYTPPNGRAIFKSFTPLPSQRPDTRVFLPLFLIEATPREVGGRIKLEDMQLTYLRLEVRPLDDAWNAPPAFNPAGTRNPTAYKPAEIGDTRTEPRTDPSKDRKIVRVGERWVMTYADDNPGRLMTAPIDGGRLGEPMVLIDEPGWGRHQCSAAATGDDQLVVVCPGPDKNVVLVRVSGVREWGKRPPNVNSWASKRHDCSCEVVKEGYAHRDGWTPGRSSGSGGSAITTPPSPTATGWT